MNPTIRILMYSDVFIFTGFGLISPILAIFVKENLEGGTILAAGIATFLYLFTKSIIQLPFSRYTDTHQNTRLNALVFGTILMAVGSFLFIPAHHVLTIYAAQLLKGVGAGLSYPCWQTLWTTHLDRHHEGFEWSLYSTLTNLGTATAAAIGATMAQLFGFTATFTIMGFIVLLGGTILFRLYSDDLKKTKPA